MSQVTLRQTFSRFRPLQIAIIVLAVVTALVHLNKGLSMSLFAGHFNGPPSGHFPGAGRPGGFGGPGGPGRAGGFGGSGRPAGAPSGFSVMSLLPLPLSTLYYMNFAGYIVLVTALYLPFLQRYQQIIRWVLIAFTLLTLVAYFLIAGVTLNPLGYADKAVEVALIVLLLIEGWQMHRQARG